MVVNKSEKMFAKINFKIFKKDNKLFFKKYGDKRSTQLKGKTKAQKKNISQMIREMRNKNVDEVRIKSETTVETVGGSNKKLRNKIQWRNKNKKRGKKK